MTNVAILIIRDIYATEREPLRVELDQSVLEQMNWQTGDAITLVPEVEGSQPGEGKLIIRKATPGELALILPDLPVPGNQGGLGYPVNGPRFSWIFPPDWVELFFPGREDPEDVGFNLGEERHWMLPELSVQTERLELKVLTTARPAAASD